MTIESGPYCPYCQDEHGELQCFEERLSRMTQFMKRRDPGLSDEGAERQSLACMRTMPAWRDHPQVVAE
ncbi:MAG: hypothetical protein GY711_26625 [bacterium]|nr:hypothetical protein [bacterium]